MKQKLILAVACAALLAACGKNEPEPAVEPTPTPTAEAEAPKPEKHPPVTAAEIPASFDGASLQSGRLVSAELSEAGTAILTRTEAGENSSGGRTTGAFANYKAPETRDFSETALEITIVAKAVGADSAPFAAAYSTNVKGNSGWSEFTAGPEMESFTFTYTVPDHPNRVDLGSDYIGVSVEEGVSVEVESISVAPAPAE